LLTSSPDSTITAPSLPAGEGNGQPITAPSASQPPIPPAPATQTGAKSGLLRFLPPAEVLRFLIVGACNTLFSYILYAGFGALFTHLFPAVPQFWIADAALICATPIAVTFSFLGFKHFVFKTRGNYLKEWVRCFAVYLPTLPAGLVIVGVATRLFLPLFAQHPDFAKYPAGVVNSAIIASYSYFGHKKFSFKK
jgi:putative flippase GtrA